MIRGAVVAGQFYPGSSVGLKKMIEGMVDDRVEKTEVIGLVSPHAGYVYSGPVAGAVISRVKFKDIFVILGPNHTGRGKAFSIMTKGDWETPLGRVKIDDELGKLILESSRYLEEDYVAHRFEHSLEVQVPFLQYFKPDVRIVPIVLAHTDGDIYKKIGIELAGAVQKLGKGVVILASSDMSHYEPQETARSKDRQAIDAMLDLNEDELLKRVDEFGISMCGYGPATVLISAARELGAKQAELVKYQTSGDTSGDYSSVVGYAGILVK